MPEKLEMALAHETKNQSIQKVVDCFRGSGCDGTGGTSSFKQDMKHWSCTKLTLENELSI